MNITTYQMTCERNVLNKASSLQTIGTMTGVVLKDTTSIINPVLTIAQSTIPNFNYLYIEEFSRYYFVDGVSSVRSGVWEVTCSEDVLMSFRSEIENQTVIVDRCSSEYDEMLKDTIINKIYPTMSVNVLGEDDFAILTYDVFEGYDYESSNSLYLVNCCPYSIQADQTTTDSSGNSSTSRVDVSPAYSTFGHNATSYTTPGSFPVKAPNNLDVGTSGSCVFFLVSANEGESDSADISSLRDAINKSTSPNNILSIRHYPFKWENILTNVTQRIREYYTFDGSLIDKFGELLYNGTSTTSIRDGVVYGSDWVLGYNSDYYTYFKLSSDSSESEIKGFLCYNTMPINIRAAVFAFTKSSSYTWKDYSPYTRYYVWLPFYGYKEIDMSQVVGHTIEIYYQVDWHKGTATIIGVLVISAYEYNCLFEETVSIAQNIPFNETNYADIVAQESAIATQAIGGAIASVVMGVGAAIAYGLAPVTGGASVMAGVALTSGLVGAATTGISTATNFASSAQQLIDKSSVGGTNISIANLVKNQKIHVIKISADIEEIEGAADIVGRPLMSQRKISAIGTGFFNCVDFHLTNFPTAWTEEINAIERQLKTGVIKQ